MTAVEPGQRDYRPILDAAEDLAQCQGAYGYAHPDRALELQESFANEVRKFVFKALKNNSPRMMVLNSIDSDLERIQRAAVYSDDAVNRVRGELHKWVDLEAGKPLPLLILMRWAPLISAILIGVAIFSVKVWLRRYWHTS